MQFPGLFAQFAGAGGLPFGGPQNALQLTHDLSWVKGAHTIRVGGLFDYQQINRAFGAFAQGLELLGTSVASALRVHAESLRISRQQAAEEQAAKASVKLTFPLVFFIFPAVLIVLAGPAAIGLFKSALFAE